MSEIAKRGASRRRRDGFGVWAAVYAGAVCALAGVAGIIWNRLVALPSYEIGDDFRARISEAGLGQIAATDVYFCLIGAATGLVVGTIAWFFFRRLGWVVSLIASLGGVFAALVTRALGEYLGPLGFEDRIAEASKGELVMVDFVTHTWVTLAVWVAAAVLPVLIASLLQRSDWISHVPEVPKTASVE